MAKKRAINVQWPLLGLDRSAPYRRQPPFSSPDCQNVRVREVIEERGRGGSRSGLDCAFYQQMGSGANARLLSELTVIKNDNVTFWRDDFSGSALGTPWTAASWETYGLAVLPALDSAITYNDAGGEIRSAISDLDVSSDYWLEIYIVPWKSGHYGTYKVYARMDNAAPDASDAGITAELSLDSDGQYWGQLVYYTGGTPTYYVFTPGTTEYALPGWFSVKISGNDVTCYWRGTSLVSQTVAAPAGASVGFGIEALEEGGVCLVDAFRVKYTLNQTAERQVKRTLLVGSAGGELWRETDIGTIGNLGGSVDLASDRELQAAERGQKLYIADNSDVKAQGTDGTVDATGKFLDAASYPDWTLQGIDVNTDVLVVTNGSANVTDGTYTIKAVIANTIETDDSMGTTGTCSYLIARGPKVFDPIADTLTLWTATSGKGQVPTNCTLCCRFRDRMVLAGDPENPHLWYMSRLEDPLDWDYSAYATRPPDVRTAISAQQAPAGTIGEAVIALIPHGDDYLVFGCRNSMWVLKGDPAAGGQIINLSREVGMVDGNAWTFTATGDILFLSHDGLYKIATGTGSYPEPISSGRLPQELRDVDGLNNTVSLVYDAEQRGIHIYITSGAQIGQDHWWYDLDYGGFVPDRFGNANHEPTAVLSYHCHDPRESGVLLGCRDGYIRRYRRSAETDEGTEIASHMTFGPFKTGGSGFVDGMLTEMECALAGRSGDVDWEVRGGDTGEQAVNATARTGHSGTWSAWKNRTARPRARGGSVVLRISNGETDRAWAVDSFEAVLMSLGRQRKTD